MDKILTKKILGLKLEDILKCVLLVGVGYCIAAMLGNCNCVEGLGPFVCVNRTSCSVDDCGLGGAVGNCNQDICPGWMVSDFGDGTPEVFAPDLIYKCEESPGAQNGYSDAPSCNRAATTEGKSQYYDVFMDNPSASVTTLSECPNPPYSPPTPATPGTPVIPGTPVTPPTPTPTPTPVDCKGEWLPCGSDCIGRWKTTVEPQNGGKPCPSWFRVCNPGEDACPPKPTPTPTPPSPCTYTGDKRYNEGKNPTSNSLTEDWWRDSDQFGGTTCNEKINDCRQELENYFKYIKGEELNRGNYTGFCLQTILGKNGDSRGDCPRKPLTTELSNIPCANTSDDACLDDNDQQIFITDPDVMTIEPQPLGTGEFNCKSFNGETYANMAWVTDSLSEDGKYQCNPNCPINDNLDTTNTNCLKCGVECKAPYDTHGWCCEDGSGDWKTRVPVIGGGTEEITSCEQLRGVGGMETFSAIESELKNASTDL